MVKKKSVYFKMDVTDDMVSTDVRYLMVNIFKVESDWAYAMYLK